MKIYAVTEVEYSDYHICALTLSSKRAWALKKIYGGEIEEYEDGELNGNRLLWKCDKYGCNADIIGHLDYNDGLTKEEGIEVSGGEVRSITVQAENEKAAEKKAQDLIAEYKAALTGIV